MSDIRKGFVKMLDVEVPVNSYRVIIDKVIIEMVEIRDQGQRADKKKV